MRRGGVTRYLVGIVLAASGFMLSLPFVASDSASGQVPAAQREVSVVDYVPGGVTPDGSHLQLALNDAPRVFVPAGLTLVVTDEISVPSGRTLLIDGTLTAAPSRPANWAMLRVAAKSDILIAGLGTLDANKAAQTLDGDGLTNFYGVWVSGTAARVTVSDLLLKDFRSGVNSPADGKWRDDCRAERLRVTGGYIGLSLVSWRNGRVIEPNVSGARHVGVSLYNAAGAQLHGGTVANIGYKSTASAGVYAGIAPDAVIDGVTIHDVEGHGIRLDNKSHRIIVSNNRISNVGWLNGVITHGASSGVAAWVGSAGGESYGVVIRGNVLRTIAGYGVIVHPGLTARVTDNDLDGIGDPGISVLGSQVTVAGNRIANADGYGVSIGPDPDGGPYQVALAIVTGNLITNSGLAGIMANGSPAAGVISGNVLSGNGAGIVVQTWVWGSQTFVPTPLVTDNVVVP